MQMMKTTHTSDFTEIRNKLRFLDKAQAKFLRTSSHPELILNGKVWIRGFQPTQVQVQDKELQAYDSFM
jgi:hypothetical protein